MLVIKIINRKGVVERFRSLVKRYAVLSKICRSLLRVPFKFHIHYTDVYGYIKIFKIKGGQMMPALM